MPLADCSAIFNDTVDSIEANKNLKYYEVVLKPKQLTVQRKIDGTSVTHLSNQTIDKNTKQRFK